MPIITNQLFQFSVGSHGLAPKEILAARGVYRTGLKSRPGQVSKKVAYSNLEYIFGVGVLISTSPSQITAVDILPRRTGENKTRDKEL
jgi:hypothetical protein